MNKDVIPYNILVNSEIIKKNKMHQQLPGMYDFLPHVYNVLMKLPFCMGSLCDDNDLNMVKIQDSFQFFIYDLPFKIRNIISLMEIGSYHDAGILFRSLVESFICYKFYIEKEDGDGLSRYILRTSKRSIKDIFESVIPGYYDDIYSTLCCLTHNNPLTQALFRGNISRQKPLESNINNITTKEIPSNTNLKNIFCSPFTLNCSKADKSMSYLLLIKYSVSFKICPSLI